MALYCMVLYCIASVDTENDVNFTKSATQVSLHKSMLFLFTRLESAQNTPAHYCSGCNGNIVQ